MQKLHLVGFTTDQKGLILSARRGTRSGGFHLPLDDALAEAVEELRARQDEADVEVEDVAAVRIPRVESALSVREIQARLRQGRSVADVARVAGVEPAWVERFATPVFAEQARVVAKVQGMALRRPRLGPSSHSIADALRRNLAGKGMTPSPEEFAAAWTTRQLADGRWTVRFAFRHRNQDQTLRFDLDETAASVTAATRLSGQLGYIAPTTAPQASATPRPREPRSGREERPIVKRATVATGFRPDGPASKPISRPAKERERATQAMRRAASRGAADAERGAARKTKEKEAAARRARTEAKAAEARARRERKAAEKAAAARDRRKAERQAAAQAKRAEATLMAAERRRAAKQKAARKAAAEKAATAKAAARESALATKEATAKEAATKRAAKPAAPRQAPARKAAAAAASTASAAPKPAVAAQARPGRPPSSRTAPALIATEEPSPGRHAARAGAVAPLPQVRPVPRTPTRLPVRLRDDQATSEAAPPRRPSPARATFRTDLAESGSRELAPERSPAPASETNGVAPPRPLGRPRRTRPLRAT